MSVAAAAAQAGTSAGAKAVPARWKALAQRLPLLAKMMELVGLESVKEEMFNLTDQGKKRGTIPFQLNGVQVLKLQIKPHNSCFKPKKLKSQHAFARVTTVCQASSLAGNTVTCSMTVSEPEVACYLGNPPLMHKAGPGVELDKERKRVQQQQYNCIFYGNPGTGMGKEPVICGAVHTP
eukprot:1138506-Pelagomonas_calceolata.AAC.9